MYRSKTRNMYLYNGVYKTPNTHRYICWSKTHYMMQRP